MLILDEPTNHLDLESREALEQALAAFPGSLLLISHDRALLDAVGSRTVAVEDGSLRSYVGGWPEYLRAREARAEQGPRRPERAADEPLAPPRTKPAVPSVKPTGRKRAPTGNRMTRAANVTWSRRSNRRKPTCEAVEEELSDPNIWSTQEQSAEASARHDQARKKVEELMRQWEQVAG